MTRRPTRFVPRRTFPQAVAVLFAVLGRLRAQGRCQGWRFRLRYHMLSRPVLVPRDTLVVPNRAPRFRAAGVSLPTAAVPGQPVGVNGMVVRTSDADDAPDRSARSASSARTSSARSISSATRPICTWT